MSDPVPRPPVPAVAWFAVAMWTGCVATEHLLWVGGIVFAVLGAAVLAAVAVMGHWWRTSVVVLACAGLAAGVVASALQGWDLDRQMTIAGDSGARVWQGIVEADPMPGSYGPVARIQLTGGPLDGARVRIGWPESQELPELGRIVRFSAILSPLPRAEPWAQRVARSGTCATGNAWRAEVCDWRPGPAGSLHEWRAAMLERMHSQPGAGGDLLEGIVLGDRRRLSGTPAEQDFQVLGLTHLVAVSGSHLALACGAVAFIARVLHAPRHVMVLGTLGAGAAYAVVTGLPYSALRSLLMIGVTGAGQLAGRRGDGIASLSAAVVAVIAMEPWAVFDVGLQLSVLAVGSLLVFGGLASHWVAAAFGRVPRLVSEPLGLTLIAQIATVPVVASVFGMVSVLAPVANAAVGALVSLALLVGLSGTVVHAIAPGLSASMLDTATSVLSGTAWLASKMAALPGAAVAVAGGPLMTVATLLGAAATWAVWPMPKGVRGARRLAVTIVCASLAVSVGPAPVKRAEVTVLDVGQGDAILVRDSGRAMLVDTGGDPRALRMALARTGIRRIDILVLTHMHDDHTGGAEALLGIVDVGWVGVPAIVTAPGARSRQDSRADPIPGLPAGILVLGLASGDRFSIGGTAVTVLWPPEDPATELAANDTSIVLHVRRGAFDMVLTGDVEEAAQHGMLREGVLGPIEVLKVPHHGSGNGIIAETLDVWSPEAALISVGRANSFGHPHAATLRLLAEYGVRVHRTDVSGDLVVSIGESGYRITGSRHGDSAGVRARICHGRPVLWASRDPAAVLSEGRHDSPEGRIAQARVPDLWRRGAAARPRPPPPEGPCGRRSRSGIQPRGLRRRDGRCERDCGRGQHVAFRFGQTARGGALHRPYGCGGSGSPCGVCKESVTHIMRGACGAEDTA